MVGKNNFKTYFKKTANKKQRFTLKKLSVGLASVAVGATLFLGSGEAVSAQETEGPGQEGTVEQTGGENPGEDPDGEDPDGEDPDGEEPGGEKPGEKPGEQKPGEKPGEQKPGEKPAEQKPGKEEKPGQTLPDTATSAWALGLLGLTSLAGGLFAHKNKED